MKSDIHPEQYLAVFVDSSADYEFIGRTTMKSETTRMIDGVEYQEVRLEISSASHPFFTGKQHFIDTAGRIDRFRRKYGGGSTAS